jgi:hypothetical protein
MGVPNLRNHGVHALLPHTTSDKYGTSNALLISWCSTASFAMSSRKISNQVFVENNIYTNKKDSNPGEKNQDY